jgi:hypothetical protein
MADEHRTFRGPICYGHEQVHPRTNLRRSKDGEKEYEIVTSVHGLTKREYFAALAMQGICSDLDSHSTSRVSGRSFSVHTAERAVEFADALIDALNQEAK